MFRYYFLGEGINGWMGWIYYGWMEMRWVVESLSRALSAARNHTPPSPFPPFNHASWVTLRWSLAPSKSSTEPTQVPLVASHISLLLETLPFPCLIYLTSGPFTVLFSSQSFFGARCKLAFGRYRYLRTSNLTHAKNSTGGEGRETNAERRK